MIDLTGLTYADFRIIVGLAKGRIPSGIRVYGAPNKLEILKNELSESGLNWYQSGGRPGDSIWLGPQGIPVESLAERIASSLEGMGHTVDRAIVEPFQMEETSIQSFILF